MNRRLRPVRFRTFAVLAAALVFAAPWVGWWTLAPLVGAAAMFRAVDGQLERGVPRPELWMFGAWVAAEAIIAESLMLTGEAALMMLSLLAVPVVTLPARFSERGVWVGVGIAAALVLGVAFATDAAAVLDNPPLVSVPLSLIVAMAMLSGPLLASDVEHRGRAGVDALTGLLNRASLEVRSAELEEQSRLTREPVGLVVLDVDRFKAVNDRDGHLAGDCVLVEVGEAIRAELRAFDSAYRSGGDEFVVLIPGAGFDDARVVGVKLHAAVNALLKGGSGATVSAGASASEGGEAFSFEGVFSAADRALYRAKQGAGFASEATAKAERIEA